MSPPAVKSGEDILNQSLTRKLGCLSNKLYSWVLRKCGRSIRVEPDLPRVKPSYRAVKAFRDKAVSGGVRPATMQSLQGECAQANMDTILVFSLIITSYDATKKGKYSSGGLS